MVRPHFVLAGAAATCLGIAGWLLAVDASKIVRIESLKNPGFEAGTDDWSIHVYGAKPTIEADAGTAHEGKQSLRISSSEPSDVALGQELMLAPGRLYRFHGWVRTRGLDPHGAPVYGTFQIQAPAGNSVIAGGTNHGGDTDWTEVVIDFEAPAGGRTRIAPFFVGFGKGTGTAWFDDLKIEEVDASKAPLCITREKLPGAINAKQCGQFIEYLCDLVPGMWAEKLYDGGFEGLSPYKFVYLKETDFREKPWHPCGATNRAEYVLDRNDKVSGETAQRIAVKDGPPCTVGIAQDGVAVDKGTACEFSCYLRQQGIEGPVRVRLERDGKELASCIVGPGGEWKKYHARLAPAETATNATLSITFRGPGTLWLDDASLMPADNVGGWRRDVVEAVKALNPGVIRFGGSALDDPNLGDFEWKDSVGDPDRRKPFRAWGGLQPTGPGLEEIVQFCRLVDAEPLICVRFSKRQPEDAAEEVQYFNGAADTPEGKLRAKNGHAEPYHVKLWQIGNERSGADYEARLAAFCKAMKEADPSITLLSSYPTEGVLKQAGDQLGYVCPHQYDCANLAACERELNATRDSDRQVWRRTADQGRRDGMEHDRRRRRAAPRQALVAGKCARVFTLSELAAPPGRPRRDRQSLEPHQQFLLRDHPDGQPPPLQDADVLCTAALCDARRVPAAADRVGRLVAGGAGRERATLSEDKSAVTLFAVNATLDEVVRPFDFSAYGDRGQEVFVWTLADRQKAGEPDVTNSFGEPERVSPVASTFRAAGPLFEYRFPPLSLTVIRWKIGS